MDPNQQLLMKGSLIRVLTNYNKGVKLEEGGVEKMVYLKKRRLDLNRLLAANKIQTDKQEDIITGRTESNRKNWLKIQNKLYAMGEWTIRDEYDVELAVELYDHGFLFRYKFVRAGIFQRKKKSTKYGRQVSFRNWTRIYKRLSRARLRQLMNLYTNMIKRTDKREVYKYRLVYDFLDVLRAEKHRKRAKQNHNNAVYAEVQNDNIHQ